MMNREAGQGVTRRRVLVVDDDEMSRTVMRHVFSLRDFEIEEACDGIQAEEMVERNGYHLVIVDLRLPRLSGLDLIERIRRKQPDLPIIIVSGEGGLDEAIEAIRHDVFFYFKKPIVNLDEFFHVVESALERERLIRENRAFQEELRDLNLQLRERVADQTREIAGMKDRVAQLFQVSPSILAARDIDEKLNLAVNALVKGRFFQRAMILLETYPNQPTQMGWASASDEETVPKKGLKTRYKEMKALLREDIRRGGSYVVDRREGDVGADPSDSTSVLLPLRGQDGRMIGIARLEEPVGADAPAEEVLHLLELFMAQLALSIEEVNLERELEESEAEYRALVDNVSDLIFRLDERGNFTFVSRRSLENLGYEWQELAGRSFYELVPDERRESARKALERLQAQPGGMQDIVMLHKDGRRLIMAVTANPLIEMGQPVGILGIARDVTEKRRLEGQVQESEERYRALTESANDAIFVIDPETYRFLEVNRRATDLLGYSREELLLMTSLDLRRPEHVARAIERIEATKISGKGRFEDAPLRRKDGREIFVDISATVLEIGGRKIYQSIVRDITEQKAAEQALRESEERFRSLVETTSDWVWAVDPNGVYTYASPKVKDLLGYEPREVIGKTPFDLMPPDEAQRVAAVFADIAKSQRPFAGLENTNLHKDGHLVVLETSGVPVYGAEGNFLGFRGIDRDITERKRTQEALSRRVMELQILSEISDALQSAVDVDTVLGIILAGVTAGEALGFNRAFILLYDEEEATLHGEAGIGPTSADEAGRIWSRLSGGGLSLTKLIQNYATEFPSNRQQMADYVRRLSIPVGEESGVFYRAVFLREATIIPNIQESPLVPSEFRKYYNARSFAVVPMISRDVVLGVLLVDNFITNKPITDDDLRRLRVFANSAALAIERARLRVSLEGKLEELTAANRELKESRDKLVRTERLSAVGEVAASVAHEIRNPLTAIGGFTRSVLSSLAVDDRNRSRLQIVVDEVRRLEGILTEVLQFARPTMPRFEATDLNGVILQTFDMMSEEIDEEVVTVERSLDAMLPAIWADPDQIRQVLLNIFRNAVHAMPEGGVLEVQTVANDEVAQVRVRDTGVGVPKTNLEKLFNAFFTTKSAGSGLGLTVSQQIVRNHGGTIDVESEVGKGSVFTVSLPLHKKGA
jgi:PAS domain S-box-containing protein